MLGPIDEEAVILQLVPKGKSAKVGGVGKFLKVTKEYQLALFGGRPILPAEIILHLRARTLGTFYFVTILLNHLQSMIYSAWLQQ